MKTSVDVPDNYVPMNDSDLVRKYESFVARLVARYNRVDSNYKDLLQHVWLQIIERRVLQKYNDSTGRMPKQLTALQACSVLQVTWGQWKMILWRGFKGDDRVADKYRVPAELGRKILTRDHGICHRCNRDMEGLRATLLEAKLQNKKVWLATREKLAKLGVPVTKKVFWVAERVGSTPRRGNPIASYRTTCLFCFQKEHPEVQPVRQKSTWAPTPIKGTWGSKAAVYSTEDIEKLKAMRANCPKAKKHEEIPSVQVQTKSLFKLYLARAVHNIYANWCRTKSRREKEMYPAPTEDGQAWETFLEDQVGPRPDVLVDLYRAVKRASKGDEKVADQMVMLLAEGKTFEDVVERLSLPKGLVKMLQK